MHPLIRIVSFLAFTLCLIHSSWPVVVVAAGVIAVGLFMQRTQIDARKLLRMASRLRWLFLAMIVLYIWMTPGTAMISGMQTPTWEGLRDGLHRVVVLLLMLGAVHWLLQTTDRNALIAALYQLIWPVRRIVRPQRLAVRMVLTLDAVAKLQSSLRFNRSRGLRDSIVEVFTWVQHRAEHEPCAPVTIPQLQAPAIWQWLMPAGLVGFYLLLN